MKDLVEKGKIPAKRDENDSYVVITLRHDFDLVDYDSDGNPQPINPENLPDNAYIGRAMIGEVHFPRTTSVGENCFKSCRRMSIVDMPLLEIAGDGAFQDCVSLTELPENLETVGNNTFNGCSSIAEVSLSELASIGDNGFRGCSSLNSVDIPKCTQIGAFSFAECTSMESFNANRLNYAGQGAFMGCSSISKVFLPYVNWHTALDDGSGETVENGMFQSCSSLRVAYLPSVTCIEPNCFKDCTNMKHLELPMVQAGNIQEGTFSTCTKLEWINLQRDVPSGSDIHYHKSVLGICDDCNVICFNGEILFGEGRAETDYKMDGADYNNKLLTGYSGDNPVYFDAFADQVGSNAFKGNETLESVIMPAVINIGANSFSGCSNLKYAIFTKFVLNADRHEMDGGVFQNCRSLKYIQMSNSETNDVEQSLRINSNWGLQPGCVIACKNGIVEISE